MGARSFRRQIAVFPAEQREAVAAPAMPVRTPVNLSGLSLRVLGALYRERGGREIDEFGPEFGDAAYICMQLASFGLVAYKAPESKSMSGHWRITGYGRSLYDQMREIGKTDN